MNGLLTVRQVADKLQVHVNAVYRYIKRGDLKAIKLSDMGRYRIPSEELDNFLKRRAQ